MAKPTPKGLNLYTNRFQLISSNKSQWAFNRDQLTINSDCKEIQYQLFLQSIHRFDNAIRTHGTNASWNQSQPGHPPPRHLGPNDSQAHSDIESGTVQALRLFPFPRNPVIFPTGQGNPCSLSGQVLIETFAGKSFSCSLSLTNDDEPNEICQLGMTPKGAFNIQKWPENFP